MSAEQQTVLVGEMSSDYVDIDTEGRVIRPFLSMVTPLVSEVKFEFDSAEGLTVQTVDPANVSLIDVTIPPGAFDRFDIQGDELPLIGTNLDRLTGRLGDARYGKGTSDPVSLRIGQGHTRVRIERTYAETTVTRTDDFLNLDHESVRERKGVEGIGPFAHRATVDVRALVDVCQHIDGFTDHVRVSERDGHLIISGSESSDDAAGEHSEASEADFGAIVEDDEEPEAGATSLFSLDYLRDLAIGLQDGKVDRTTLRWADEFPLMLEFERTADEQVVYGGQYMLAPRIKEGSP